MIAFAQSFFDVTLPEVTSWSLMKGFAVTVVKGLKAMQLESANKIMHFTL